MTQKASVLWVSMALEFHRCLAICISITKKSREQGGAEVTWELRKQRWQ